MSPYWLFLIIPASIGLGAFATFFTFVICVNTYMGEDGEITVIRNCKPRS